MHPGPAYGRFPHLPTALHTAEQYAVNFWRMLAGTAGFLGMGTQARQPVGSGGRLESLVDDDGLGLPERCGGEPSPLAGFLLTQARTFGAKYVERTFPEEMRNAFEEGSLTREALRRAGEAYRARRACNAFNLVPYCGLELVRARLGTDIEYGLRHGLFTPEGLQQAEQEHREYWNGVFSTPRAQTL